MPDADKTVLFSGKRFRVERVEQVLPDGSRRPCEVVRHPGAVVILPWLDDGRVCLLRNFRPAVGQWLIELPAGTLEPNEDPAETARRELIEETGFRAGRLQLLHSFFASPGILDERMHLYLATGLTAGPTDLEAGEQIEPLIVPWQEAMAMIGRGEIRDAKTLCGLLFYDRLRQRA